MQKLCLQSGALLTKVKGTQMTLISPDYTVGNAANLLSVSIPTIYKLIRLGKISVYKVGRSTRIKRESLDLFREKGGSSCIS